MKPFLRVFNDKGLNPPPIWLMRQAGRYLPEYRALRAKSRNFLNFCYTAELAVQATLQPIHRFGFDAAIIFSDILVVPDALGQLVWFEEGEGPRLDAISHPSSLSKLTDELDLIKLEPVYEALRLTKAALPSQTALIGFCGAPFTLATYMIAGKGTSDQAPARLFAYQNPKEFSLLIALLTKACSQHLIAQIEAGAEVVQIFDSWAGVLPISEFQIWCIEPVKKIISTVKKQYPDVKIISFPRAMAGNYTNYSIETGLDVLGLDTSANLSHVRQSLPQQIITQGNLDPLVLVAGGDGLDRAIDTVMQATRNHRHIFNLGHGILQTTPISHVERLIERVRTV